MDSYILGITANRAVIRARGDSLVHLVFSDMSHAKRNAEELLKSTQRQPVCAGSDPLPGRMMCHVGPLLPAWVMANLSFCAMLMLPLLYCLLHRKTASPKHCTFLGIKSYNHWPEIPPIFLLFSLSFSATCSCLSLTPVLMSCYSLAEPLPGKGRYWLPV